MNDQVEKDLCPECGLRGMTTDEVELSARGGPVPDDVCPGDHYEADGGES